MSHKFYKGGSKMADGLSVDDYSEVGPEQAPAKTPTLTEEDRLQFKARLPKSEEQYLSYVRQVEAGELTWEQIRTRDNVLTMETALCGLTAHMSHGFKEVEAAMKELLDNTITKYRPDLYAAQRYTLTQDGGSKLTKWDAISVFVYTIELYDATNLQRHVSEIKPEEFVIILEKYLNQKELDVVLALKNQYRAEDGNGFRKTFHKIWEEIEFEHYETNGSSDLTSEPDPKELESAIQNLKRRSMSSEGTKEVIMMLKEKLISVEEFVRPDAEWHKEVQTRLRDVDKARLERVRNMFRRKMKAPATDPAGMINLGDFGAGSSVPNQLYGRMNRALRELEGAFADVNRLLTTYTADVLESLLSKYDGKFIEDATTVAMKQQRAVNEFSRWKEFFYLVTEALSHLPVDRKHDTCYRGIPIEFKENQYSAGKYFAWPAFSSTSGSRTEALKFAGGGKSGGTLFVVQEQWSGRDVHLFSRFPEEDEVLLPPQSYFKVTHRTSELENIMNKSGPIITVQHLNLEASDIFIPNHPMARMVWITLFNAVPEVRFELFEQVHIEGMLGQRFAVSSELWKELKYNESASDAHKEKYMDFRRLFTGEEKLKLESFAKVAKGENIRAEHIQRLHKASNHLNGMAKTLNAMIVEKKKTQTESTVSVAYHHSLSAEEQPCMFRVMVQVEDGSQIYMTKPYDYCDYLEVILRAMRRELETSFAAITKRVPRNLVDWYSGRLTLQCNLENRCGPVDFSYSGLSYSTPAPRWSIGGHLSYTAKNSDGSKTHFFLAPDKDTAGQDIIHVVSVSQNDAINCRSLLRGSSRKWHNGRFLFLDDEHKINHQCEGMTHVLCVLCKASVDRANQYDLEFGLVPIKCDNEMSVFNTMKSTPESFRFKDYDVFPVFVKDEPGTTTFIPDFQRALEESSSSDAIMPVHRRFPLEGKPAGVVLLLSLIPILPHPATGRQLLWEMKEQPNGSKQLCRMPLETQYMTEYLPYSVTLLSIFWKSYLPSIFCVVSSFALLTTDYYINYKIVNIVTHWMVYLTFGFVFLTVLFTNRERNTLIKLIANDAPHASARGSVNLIVSYFSLFGVAVVYAVSQFAGGFVVQGDKTFVNFTYPITSVVYFMLCLLGVNMLFTVYLFLVSNQIMFDRTTNFIEQLRNLSATDFIDSKSLTMQYLSMNEDIDRVRKAWEAQGKMGSAAVYSLLAAGSYTLIVHFGEYCTRSVTAMEYAVGCFYLSAGGLICLLVMRTCRRWNEVANNMVSAISSRYEEVSANPKVTIQSLESMLTLIRCRPMSWPLPMLSADSHVSSWAVIFVFTVMLFGILNPWILSGLCNEEPCTIGMYPNAEYAQVIALPDNIQYQVTPPFYVSQGDYILSRRKYGTIGIPTKTNYGLFQCEISGCEGQVLLSYGGGVNKISASYCQQMFELHEDKAKNTEILTKYRVFVNTSKPVWKYAQKWAQENQLIRVFLNCVSETGAHEEKLCLLTLTKYEGLSPAKDDVN